MTSTEEKPAPIIFGDESLSDCTLVVDNQDFKIHKMVLAARSEVFKAMFYGGFKESKDNRIEIKDVSVENFRRFLEIIYTTRISDPEFLRFPTKKDSHTHVTIRLKEKDTHKNTANIHYTESFEKYFHDFWKNTRELINVADRFDLSPLVKYYLKTVIDNQGADCKNKECHVCFNYEALFLVHNYGQTKSFFFQPYMYWYWLEYAGQEPLPCSIPIERQRDFRLIVDS